MTAQNQDFPGEFPFEGVTECIERMSGEGIEEPGAFCAAWYHQTYGKWPAENKLATHMATAQFNRYEEFEGRPHLVAPVIAVMEEVLNGEFCPADEIGRYIDSWNGIPLPLDHPMDRGMPISANQPHLIQTRSLGRFFNARFDGRRLHGELWIDIEKANSLGGDALTVLQRLENGEPLEVSTAYFRDLEPGEGEYGGQPYNGIQRNLRPDHLALLPNGVGAASWEHGAGAPRVNEKEGGGKTGMWQKVKAFIANSPLFNQNELSHDEIEQQLEQAMIREKGDAMRFIIRERFDDYFIYQEADLAAEGFTGPLWRRNYSINENGEVVLGDQEEVKKVVTYEPVTNEQEPGGGNESDGGEIEVNKKEKVNGLIANQATQFKEEDRQFLEGLTEEQLDKLEPITNHEEGEEQTPSEPSNPEPSGEEPKGEEEGEEEDKPQNFDEWVEQIPDEEVREEMKENRKRIKQRRDSLIENLSKSDKCAFDKEDLQGMKTNQLEKLSKSIAPEDYSGVGGPRGNVQEEEDEVPAPPPVVMAKRGQGNEGGNQ